MQRVSEQLPNGLRVELISTSSARQAAALVEVGCGSFHEPDDWPGLAHLLEHLLFAGSQQFRQQQRLMAWVQGQGGQLNASTHACHSAYFFEVAPEKLAAGTERLTDMLAQPLLLVDDICRECQVIDAEFQLLQKDSRTLAAAAFTGMLTAPAEAARFQVGNLQVFGSNFAALQQALRHFHQRHYVASNMTLWLHGPQSIDALRQLAQRFGATLPAGEPPLKNLTLQAVTSSKQLQSTHEQLRLGWVVTGVDPAAFALLRQLVTDQASYSLLTVLRDRQLAEAIRFDLATLSSSSALIHIDFSLNSSDAASALQVESLFYHWRQQLMHQAVPVLEHYAALACNAFTMQSPMAQLRARVLDCAPSDKLDRPFIASWQALLAQCQPETQLRLLSGKVAGQPVTLQGFQLQLGALPLSGTLPAAANFSFFTTRQPDMLACAIDAPGVPLAHHPAPGNQATLVMHPAAEKGLDDNSGEALRAVLQTPIGDARHTGVTLCWEKEQGVWLLSLSGEATRLPSALALLVARLRQFPAAAWQAGKAAAIKTKRQAYHGIAIRALLAALPVALQSPVAVEDISQLSWSGALYGGDEQLCQAMAQQLAQLPGRWLNAARPETKPPGVLSIATESTDRAILLFCPTPSSAIWQQLAQIYEPHFFQRLRVEQNLGYVVSCRFQFCAGESGILFALQSPDWHYEALWQAIEDFLGAMAVQLSERDSRLLAETEQTLPGKAQDEPRHRWLAEWRAIPSEERSPVLTELLAAHAILSQQWQQGWRLSNQP